MNYMREKIIQNIGRMQSKVVDLQDRLDDGVPSEVAKKIRQQIDLLQDLIFRKANIWKILKNGLDN